jgi:hypothetical protein
MRHIKFIATAIIATSIFAAPAPAGETQSVARQWNEVLLEGIRHDLARPTVHARNLSHASVMMWDSWAI